MLFRQFAVTISASVLISAVNALTLSPALCAMFLRRSGPRRGIMGAHRSWNRSCARRLCGDRASDFALLGHLASFWSSRFAFGSLRLMRLTPTGFLPEEDQGSFFINVQLPDGASLNRTSDAVRQVEAILKSMPQVQDTISIIGFSMLDSYSAASNNAFMVAQLKPFAERTGPPIPCKR